MAQGPQPSPPPNSYAAQDDGNEIKPPSANVIVAVCLCVKVRVLQNAYSLSLAADVAIWTIAMEPGASW